MKVIKLHDASNVDASNVVSADGLQGGTVVTLTGTQTLTNKTITAPNVSAPVLSGSATGTYTLAGTPTITAPAISAPTITGAMTVADGATFTTPNMTINVEAVAAAGSAQGDATAATETGPALIHGTGADGTKGIKLPAAAAGRILFVKNADAANAILKVYPASGDAINALSGDTAISMAAKTSAVFIAVDATTWFTIPLLPS